MSETVDPGNVEPEDVDEFNDLPEETTVEEQPRYDGGEIPEPSPEYVQRVEEEQRLREGPADSPPVQEPVTEPTPEFPDSAN